MKVLFTTVVRDASIEQGGEFVALDWETKKILSRLPIFPKDPAIDDPNPRGNARGGRGIAILKDRRIVVSSYHTLYILNHEFEIIKSISHPLMSALHEVYCSDENHLWVTATAIDAALKVNLDTGQVVQEQWPRENAYFQAKLGLVSLDINKKS